MHTIERMMSTSPDRLRTTDSLTDCIERCIECAQACVACADACLAESEAMSLRRCIRLNQDCADICAASAKILTRAYSNQRPRACVLNSSSVRSAAPHARRNADTMANIMAIDRCALTSANAVKTLVAAFCKPSASAAHDGSGRG